MSKLIVVNLEAETITPNNIRMNNVYYNTSYYTDIWLNPSDQWDFKAEANIINYNAQSFKESVSIPVWSSVFPTSKPR